MSDTVAHIPFPHSPLRIFLILLATICGFEMGVMYFLPAVLPDAGRLAEGLTDALTLSLLVAPVLWGLVIAPMRSAALAQQREAQTALAETKEFWENLVRNSAVPTFVLDAGHRVLLWNRACEELTGVREAQVFGTAESWRAFYDCRRPVLADIVIDGSLKEFLSCYSTCRGSAFIPEGIQAEGWYPNMNGRKRYIFFNAAPIRNGSGELIAVIETVEDITERKQGAEKLQERENRLQAILNTAVDGIVAIDEHGIIESANPACEHLFGYPEGFLTGRNVSILMPSPFREEHNSYLSRYLLTGEKRVIDSRRETVARHRDGTIFPVELAVSEVHLGERRLFTGIISQIAERKRREEEMKQTLSLLEATLEATADGILVVDPQGRIVSYNQRFAALWQIPDAVLASGTDEKLTALAVAQLNDPHGFMAKTRYLHDHPEVESCDLLEFRDGRTFERSSRPQRIEEAIVGRVWSFRDVTAEKKLEFQLRHSQKMEAIGTLAGGVAHDFNNILTAIIGYGSILQMKLAESDPLAAHVGQILAAADRAAGLTRGLLAYSRKEAICPQPVDLNDIVRKINGLLSRIIGEEIALSIELADEGLTVLADSGQVEQILMNLATNARDAMPEGGRLIITTAVAELDERFIATHGYGEVGDYACLCVSDSGTGMDRMTRERIFEPFFSTKETGKGTGLGLSIVYGIVKQHRGFINVYSEEGCGTTFRVYLPLTSRTATRPGREEHAVPRGGTETILLIEDNREVRELMKEVLETSGYRVLEGVNGDDGLRKFREHLAEVQLLVLDVIMPGKNGKEVYDEARAIRPDIRAIFTSGYTAEIINSKGICCGELNFVSKPLSPTTLLAKVREVLER